MGHSPAASLGLQHGVGLAGGQRDPPSVRASPWGPCGPQRCQSALVQGGRVEGRCPPGRAGAGVARGRHRGQLVPPASGRGRRAPPLAAPRRPARAVLRGRRARALPHRSVPRRTLLRPRAAQLRGLAASDAGLGRWLGFCMPAPRRSCPAARLLSLPVPPAPF